MKSVFYRALLVSGVFAAVGDAYSLYDAAPMVGLPESHAIRYSMSARVGYDSNVNWSYTGHEDESVYVNASVSAAYADMESVNKLSYNVRLGASHYFGLEDNSSVSETRGDCALSASVVHAFGAADTYSGSLSVTYSPQPDYASGYSPAYSYGDIVTVSQSNVYSHAIDARWSWNASVSFQSVNYTENEERSDDRYYLSAGTGLQYRESSLLTYMFNLGYSRDLRDCGQDSNVYTATVGFQRSLDPFSSCGGSIGIQARQYSSDTIVNPCGNFSYRRKVSEGLNVSFYTSFSNENVDTYRSTGGSSGASYLSDMTWRVGMNSSYVLSPDVTYNFGASLMRSNYSRGGGRLMNEETLSVQLTAGLSYAFSRDLRGDISGSYNWYMRDYEVYDQDMNRWTVSTGLTYSF